MTLKDTLFILWQPSHVMLGTLYLDPLQMFVILLDLGGEEGPIHVAPMTPVSLSSPTMLNNDSLSPKYVKMMVFDILFFENERITSS